MYKADYSMLWSDYVPEAGNNTIKGDLMDVYKLVLYHLRRWKEELDRLPPHMEPHHFQINSIREFLSVIGPGLLELIGTPTIVLLMDKDS